MILYMSKPGTICEKSGTRVSKKVDAIPTEGEKYTSGGRSWIKSLVHVQVPSTFRPPFVHHFCPLFAGVIFSMYQPSTFFLKTTNN